jgi:hypothetical protein
LLSTLFAAVDSSSDVDATAREAGKVWYDADDVVAAETDSCSRHSEQGGELRTTRETRGRREGTQRCLTCRQQRVRS